MPGSGTLGGLMSNLGNDDYERVLTFWFGELDGNGRADRAQAERWFKKDPAFDQQIRENFLADHAALASGQRDHWLTTPRGRLASVIVLDQFSRNMFRGTAAMFASDTNSLAIVLDGIAQGADRHLRIGERPFFYMPLMHAEDREIQRQSVAMFTALRDEQPAADRNGADEALRFAIAHRDIIARFGRFPHRNDVLGRTSTAEEIAFLTQPGSSF